MTCVLAVPGNFLALCALIAAIATRVSASELDSRIVIGPFNMPGTHTTIDAASHTGVADADKDIPPARRDTEQILWGVVADPIAEHPTGQMPDTNCFDRGYTIGITNRFMDQAVAKFCKASDGTILDLKNKTNSVSMICDNSHVDNKHGGQLDLRTFDGKAIDHRFNDHLFYLADPAPPRDGRNMYCTNWNRFVPNLENTQVYDEVDPCYDAHMGFGGKDLWWTDPPPWTDHDKGKADHETKKADCVADHGEYDGYGGTKDYYS
nr:hypothetical protein B0A51_11690 [Rachicladosporium sp. CCFEE 5018]